MIVENRVVEVSDFFGCLLHRVNPLILRIGLTYRPEWLAQRPKLNLLPRWNETAQHCVPVSKKLKPSEIGERLVWVVEELHDEWHLTTEGFHFASAADAVHFKLRWF